MKRLIFSITLLIYFSYNGFCQQEGILFLKNGSIIKGIISENDSVKKITTTDGNLWVFKEAEIAKIEKINNTSNYFNSLKVDVGFILGKVDYKNTNNIISFLAVYSIPFGSNFYFGLGTGLEYFKNTYLPVVLNLRFQPKRVAFIMQGGYAVPLKEEGLINEMKYNYEPGFFFNPEFAYVFPSINGTSFTISAGLRSQKISAKQINYAYNNDYKIIEKYNRLVLRVGYTFR